MERLSNGAALIGDKQRIKTEFSEWVLRGQDPDHSGHPRQLVWCKLALVVGYFFYVKKTEELPLTLRKSFLDFVCGVALSELLSNPATTFIPFKGRDNVAALNKGKTMHQQENKTFKAMFLSEFWGYITLFSDSFNQVLADHYYQNTGNYPSNSEMGSVDGDSWCKLIYQAFKADKVSDQLPMFKIFPSLFASMRWN